MTSSYNISRRPVPRTSYNFDAHVTQLSCPVNFVAHPIVPSGGDSNTCTNSLAKTNGKLLGNSSDWKMCLPQLNQDQLPITYPTRKSVTDLLEKTGRRHFVTNLYNLDNHSDQFRTDFYPRESRPPERKELDEKDYYQLPIQVDGTGYEDISAWVPSSVLGPSRQNYNGGHFAWRALEHIPQLSSTYDPTQLIQRSAVQELNRQELEKRKCIGAKPFQQIVERRCKEDVRGTCQEILGEKRKW